MIRNEFEREKQQREEELALSLNRRRKTGLITSKFSFKNYID